MNGQNPLKSKIIGRVLTVAGSDPSGGAGIQADIKTITSLGGYASSAITALTVQNTTGVFDTFQVSGEFVRAQIEAVLDDIGADCIKIGMLGAHDVIQSVMSIIIQNPLIPIILDPVMVSTSGEGLIDQGAVTLLKGGLVPLADVITPNLMEVFQLSGIEIKTKGDMKRAGEALLKMGAKAALIKGGHMEGDQLVNLLVTKNNTQEFTSQRIETSNTHGTGCTLASAIATFIAQGVPMSESVGKAGDYVHQAILNAPNLGKGFGPLGHKL